MMCPRRGLFIGRCLTFVFKLCPQDGAFNADGRSPAFASLVLKGLTSKRAGYEANTSLTTPSHNGVGLLDV